MFEQHCAMCHFESSNPNAFRASKLARCFRSTSNLHLALHFCFCWYIPVGSNAIHLLISAFSHNSAVINQNVFCNITQLLYDNCHPKFGRYVHSWLSFISSQWKVLNVYSIPYIDFDLWSQQPVLLCHSNGYWKLKLLGFQVDFPF